MTSDEPHGSTAFPTPGVPAPYGGAPGYGAPGYGAPGYGAPGYGPPPPQGSYGPVPGYGPAPGYGPYPPQYRRPTNTMAILALVLAFVFAPVGLVMGIIARKQIRQTGEEGDGLALAGIIVGAIGCAIFVLVIIFWIITFAALSGSVTY